MKTVINLLICLYFATGANAQTENLDTKSVTLDNFISFIADNFPLETVDEDNEGEEEDEITSQNITFLLETSKRNFSTEDEIILKQAFKFLSNRLTEDDTITIIVYSGQNGLVINNESPKSLKKILHALSDIKDNITEDYEDGIGEAYRFANSNLSQDANNILVMVRNPNAKSDAKPDLEIVEQSNVKVSKNNTKGIVLLTAISLLPELIEVIKK